MNTDCVKIVALIAFEIAAFSLLVWLPRQDQIYNESKYNSYVTPYINEALSEEGVVEIKSINTAYNVKVLHSNGRIYKEETPPQPNVYDIRKVCKFNLQLKDMQIKEPFYYRILLTTGNEITNTDKLLTLNACVKKYLNTTKISSDALLYILGDDRISSNLHHDFLNTSVSNALKDNAITYSEMYLIYRNLDKALKLNLESEIGKKTQSMKDSINTQTPRNQKAAIYAQD